MKNKNVILLCLLAMSCSLFAETKSAKALFGCTKVENINSNYIYKNAAPLRRGGEGTPLVGFQEVPTLIMKRNVSTRGFASVFNSKGGLITRCGWKTASEFAGGRYKCSANTRSMRKAAISKGGNPAGIFKVSPRLCVRVPDLGKCVGSVKGKCNQILR